MAETSCGHRSRTADAHPAPQQSSCPLAARRPFRATTPPAPPPFASFALPALPAHPAHPEDVLIHEGLMLSRRHRTFIDQGIHTTRTAHPAAHTGTGRAGLAAGHPELAGTAPEAGKAASDAADAAPPSAPSTRHLLSLLLGAAPDTPAARTPTPENSSPPSSQRAGFPQIHRRALVGLAGRLNLNGMDESTDALTALLRDQHGLASRSQLLAVGLSASSLRWRLGRQWQAVLPGVVAAFTGTLDQKQRLIAAQLYAGPSAFVSSWTAASWHGVESARLSPTIRMTVPAQLSARRAGRVVVNRTTRPDLGVWNRGPLRLGSRARAVVDAAREVRGERSAKAIVIEAVQRQLVTAQMLRHELESGPRQGSAQVRLAVGLAETGAWSVPEADLVQALKRSASLPEVWANPWLTTPDGLPLPTPDAWVDEVALAIQVHSRTYHLRDQDWNATVSADSALGECGIVVLGVTPDRVIREPASVRQRVERAYAALRDRPRPDVQATPRPA